ncbi:zinc finger, CCHC-type containing protein [Tanacetum coccineum]|uniref:Zinc finger, CCHC-type containing protein n=1 Tax=Tanacetum coccineum TaxID=301880 RepID=A0ABQ5FBE1_9ASTR
MHSLKEIKSLFKFLSETLQDYGTMPIFKRTFSQDLDLLEQHLTKDILSRTDCATTLTDLRTTFENAFNSELKARMQNYTRYDAQSFYDAMIFNMDSLGKYMLELILHQQQTPQLLKQKKLMQTQEDHSHPIPALNVDSLKVDLVVIQNTCSEKEDSNSETASSKLVKECSLNFETKDVHAIKYKMSKAKERCMAYFRSLHSHLQVLSKDDLKGTHVEHGFRREFMSIFGQDVDTFTSTMLLNSTTFVEYTGLEGSTLQRYTYFQHLADSHAKMIASRSGNDTDAIKQISDPFRRIANAEVGLTSGFLHESYSSLVHKQGLTVNPHHIINARKPSVKFFHIFGSLCYIVRDGENLDKMKEKGDACIFVGYSTQSKAYRVFNKRTRMIVETIHVNFDELPQMASDHVSSDPGPQCSTTVLEQDSLSPGPQSQENVPQVAETVTTSNELELLYSPMFSELLNGTSPVMSKSSAVHAADNPNKRQQHNTTHTSTTTDVADPPPLNIQSTHQTPTQVPTVTAPENIIQAETNTENA